MYPVLFEVFGFPVSSFGVMVALGFVVGGFLASDSFERAGLDREAAWDVLTWCVVGGLLGAKLWYVGEFMARNAELPFFETLFSFGGPLLSRGGLTWYGGLVGGLALGVFGAHRAGVPIKLGLDSAAPTLAIGQAIGRIGCFLVGDDYGVPSEVPWAVAFPEGLPPTEVPVHPTMLYESAWLFIGTAWLAARRGKSPSLFAEYLMIQGLGRFAIEFWRVNPEVVGGLTNAQLMAAALGVLGLAGWLYWRRREAAVAGAAVT
jgi:phosphatidylglycerol:prolipoprotein diacylglycerol transferase